MNTLQLLTVTLSLATAAALAGCAAPSVDDAGARSLRAESPEGPLRLRFDVDDARALFGDGANVTLLIDSDAPRGVRAGVTLPEGVRVVSGSLEHDGALSAPLTLAAVLRADAPGDHVLRAWAEASMPAGARAAPSALLGIRGDANAAEAYAPERAPLDLRVDLAADPQEPTHLIATIVSPRALDARILVEHGALELVDGEPARETSLAAHAPLEIRYRVALPAEGTYMLAIVVHPDASIDGGVYTDQIYLTRADGAVKAHEREDPGVVGGERPGADPPGSGSGDNATQP